MKCTATTKVSGPILGFKGFERGIVKFTDHSCFHVLFAGFLGASVGCRMSASKNFPSSISSSRMLLMSLRAPTVRTSPLPTISRGRGATVTRWQQGMLPPSWPAYVTFPGRLRDADQKDPWGSPTRGLLPFFLAMKGKHGNTMCRSSIPPHPRCWVFPSKCLGGHHVKAAGTNPLV